MLNKAMKRALLKTSFVSLKGVAENDKKRARGKVEGIGRKDRQENFRVDERGG